MPSALTFLYSDSPAFQVLNTTVCLARYTLKR